MNGIPTKYNIYNNLSFKNSIVSNKEPNKLKFKSSVNQFISRRKRVSREETTTDMIQSFAGALLGTALMMGFLMKKQNIKNPLKLKYELGEMLALSGAPIVGGVSLAMIGNDANTNFAKSREGVFQFLNAAIPTWLAAATLKWCDSTKIFKNSIGKFVAVASTILIGMHGAAALSNIICDPEDKYPDRKLNLLDSIANIDDLFGVLVLAKVPLVGKLHLDKLLPIIYTFCGYRAGKSN